MADKFRKLLDTNTGKGGVHCHCCNDYRGSDKKVLRRIARRVLKQETINEVNND